MSLQEDFAAAFRASRAESGLSQSAVARELGTTERTVRNWEKAAFLPDMASLIMIGRLFGWNPPFPNPPSSLEEPTGTGYFPSGALDLLDLADLSTALSGNGQHRARALAA